MSAKLDACDSGNPYNAKELICCTMLAWTIRSIPLAVIPARSFTSRFFIRSQERRMPTARRNSSASAIRRATLDVLALLSAGAVTSQVASNAGRNPRRLLHRYEREFYFYWVTLPQES